MVNYISDCVASISQSLCGSVSNKYPRNPTQTVDDRDSFPYFTSCRLPSPCRPTQTSLLLQNHHSDLQWHRLWLHNISHKLSDDELHGLQSEIQCHRQTPPDDANIIYQLEKPLFLLNHHKSFMSLPTYGWYRCRRSKHNIPIHQLSVSLTPTDTLNKACVRCEFVCVSCGRHRRHLYGYLHQK